MRQLAEGINALVSRTHEACSGVAGVIAGLARGDLGHTVEGHYEGIFAAGRATCIAPSARCATWRPASPPRPPRCTQPPPTLRTGADHPPTHPHTRPPPQTRT